MSMLSTGLHRSIQRARGIASEQRNAHATPEHLLLALIDDPDAAPVMRACNVDTERLRRAVSIALLAGPDEANPAHATVHPDLRFRRIVRRTVSHIRSVELDAITGAHVLVEIFADPAGRFLREQGMTRYDTAFYVCHGMAAHSAATGSGTDRTTLGVLAKGDDDTLQTRSHVVLVNDIYTPIELVISLLTEVLSIRSDEAATITLSAHQDGAGVCGTWRRSEARGVAQRMMARAREFQHPLRCVTAPYRGRRVREVTSRWLAWLDRHVWEAFEQRAR